MDEDLTYHHVARLEDLKAGCPLRVRIGNADIAIYLFGEEVYATDNICTHDDAFLSDGFVEGDSVECPLHGACFNFRTGQVLSGPTMIDLRVYAVRVEDGGVAVGLPTSIHNS